MSVNQIRNWLKLVESASQPLNEFDTGGEGATNYYVATLEYIQDYKDDPEGQSPEGMADDLAWLQRVADGFLKGMEPGFTAVRDLESMLRDDLAEFYVSKGLPFQKDWKDYMDKFMASRGQRAAPAFNKEIFVKHFADLLPETAKRLFWTGGRQGSAVGAEAIEKLFVQNFSALMQKSAGDIAELMANNLPKSRNFGDYIDDEEGHEISNIIQGVYSQSSLNKSLHQKVPVLADDIALSVGNETLRAVWNAYVRTIKSK